MRPEQLEFPSPSPSSVVAVLTVLTQPEAASSKSSTGRPRHLCQSRSENRDKRSRLMSKKCAAGLADCLAVCLKSFIHTCMFGGNYTHALIEAKPYHLHLSTTHSRVEGAACKISFDPGPVNASSGGVRNRLAYERMVLQMRHLFSSEDARSHRKVREAKSLHKRLCFTTGGR